MFQKSFLKLSTYESLLRFCVAYIRYFITYAYTSLALTMQYNCAPYFQQTPYLLPKVYKWMIVPWHKYKSSIHSNHVSYAT